MRQLKVLLRTLKQLVRDPRIPRPIRWLLIVGLLPVPGPFDEAVLLVALALVAVFCRPVYRQVKADAQAQLQRAEETEETAGHSGSAAASGTDTAEKAADRTG